MAVFSGVVDKSIKSLWNKINLALILHCLPSEIENESNRDIQATKIILAARKEMEEKLIEGGS